MPSFILANLAPVDPRAIAGSMLAMQFLAEGGVGSKLLNRGSRWIRMTFCTPRLVSSKRCLLFNLHALVHPREARAGGPRPHRVGHAHHAVVGGGRRGEQVVEQGLALDPADVLHADLCIGKWLSDVKPTYPRSSLGSSRRRSTTPPRLPCSTCSARHAVPGGQRRGEQLVEHGLVLEPANVLHAHTCFGETLSVVKPARPRST